MIQGDFEGIGAYIENNASDIYIRGVLPGSPAQEAGLLP
jgi:C-terminal processing protease CtpA/Prc